MPLKSRCVTSGDGLKEFEAAIAERGEREKKKADAKAARDAAKAAKQAARDARGPVAEFSGALTSKNKDDLTEIADALGLNVPSTSGSKGPSKHDLINTIQHHLNTHTEQLKTNPRFRGLLPGLRGRRRPQQEANATSPITPLNTPPDSRIAPFPMLQPYLMQNLYTIPPNNYILHNNHSYHHSRPFDTTTPSLTPSI
ncbi:hypothetical protein EDB85DRAFT_1888126 [Lactarius pseudohatsudake]|nr:hypothetical protein EDB85DRAFT_1888126 [Lactarius pseudohatsudake]